MDNLTFVDNEDIPLIKNEDLTITKNDSVTTYDTPETSRIEETICLLRTHLTASSQVKTQRVLHNHIIELYR